jgi:hypothetical protein
MVVLVECYSGVEYAEYPTAFQWEEMRLSVEEVLADWRTPQGKSFRVRAANGRIFDLVYDEISDEWIVNAIQSGS